MFLVTPALPAPVCIQHVTIAAGEVNSTGSRSDFRFSPFLNSPVDYILDPKKK